MWTRRKRNRVKLTEPFVLLLIVGSVLLVVGVILRYVARIEDDLFFVIMALGLFLISLGGAVYTMEISFLGPLDIESGF